MSKIERMNRELAGAAFYALKLLLFSLAAGVPIYLIRTRLDARFAHAGSRIVSAGVPLAVMTLIFGAIGIALLAVSKDRVAGSLANAFVSRVKRRRS